MTLLNYRRCDLDSEITNGYDYRLDDMPRLLQPVYVIVYAPLSRRI